MLLTTFRGWPARRWVAVTALVPLLGATFLTLAAVSFGDPSVGWFMLMGLAAVLAAGVIGSYVPREGFHPDLGCAPCAVLPVATVVGGMIAVHAYGSGVAGPALATAATLFGMTQRLSNVTGCDLPAAAGPGAARPTRR